MYLTPLTLPRRSNIVTAKTHAGRCGLCGLELETPPQSDAPPTCSACLAMERYVCAHPEAVKTLWLRHQDEAILPRADVRHIENEGELPDVLDGKRYRTIDRDRNKWYLSVSEVDGRPVEMFASTAFDRDHELQSRISNLTTITRLISLILRHISLGEPLTFEKCLKQIQRSSRQKNDLPDMLYGVLNRYHQPPR